MYADTSGVVSFISCGGLSPPVLAQERCASSCPSGVCCCIAGSGSGRFSPQPKGEIIGTVLRNSYKTVPILSPGSAALPRTSGEAG
eukprot:8708012-Alexandrium_andersonii.AAC.1